MTRNTSASIQEKKLDSNSVEHTKKQACLYVVATPIGNLEDITARAERILKEVSVIAAEDTRHTQKLLHNLGIKNQLISLHDHNEEARSEQLVARLRQGENLALVSDAGTPLISDPGYTLVNQVRAAGFEVVPVPGVSALTAALSVAGLPTDRFYFGGFLPAKAQARTSVLEALRQQQGTLVFYESPHRLLASLEALKEVLGADREACLAREISKRFETFLQAPLVELLERVKADANQQKGEFVLLVAGYQGEAASSAWSEACRWLLELKEHLPPSQACALVAKMTGVKKKQLYQWMLEQDAGKG
ncbi:16S rRNA (cytidine(1402)-2'-O)-methyltransferase [Marinospirillum perlucidum]|uniref:16S rRNA (cytidine(1402)-2'-O)-methyltransferase n=1 Tax=Marinospirillum perlucidum TaxID=1982602 RepID=UPI000DF36687|nr:16S rRNA (cytidine(1402)-2'-O)-methyltransferase [Marinospirillum perlucidum]